MLNQSNKGQRELIAAYESIADLMLEPSPTDWRAWVCTGQHEKKYNTLIYKRNLL